LDNEQTIGKAIVFIENNLYEQITACDVSDAVSYSYYHFHRYFQAVMGETIGSYIRSRRLTQAARELVHSENEKRILDIAISLQFESNEAFTRAFKARYQMTPKQYRKNGVDILIANRPSDAYAEFGRTNYSLTPEIIDVTSKRILGIRFETSVAENKRIMMWEKLNRQLSAMGDWTRNTCRYGIFEVGGKCSRDSFHEESSASEFIGIEMTSDFKALTGFEVKELVGGKYARFVHSGPVGALFQTYRYIWGVWFPKSRFEIADRDDFECYTERFLGTDCDKSQIDIYFPIA
jgi:AraC family transcriptional regulator